MKAADPRAQACQPGLGQGGYPPPDLLGTRL